MKLLKESFNNSLLLAVLFVIISFGISAQVIAQKPASELPKGKQTAWVCM